MGTVEEALRGCRVRTEEEQAKVAAILVAVPDVLEVGIDALIDRVELLYTINDYIEAMLLRSRHDVFQQGAEVADIAHRRELQLSLHLFLTLIAQDGFGLACDVEVECGTTLSGL